MSDRRPAREPNALFMLGGVLLLVPSAWFGFYGLIATAFAASRPGEGDLLPQSWSDVLWIAAVALGLAALAGACLAGAIGCIMRGVRGRWPRHRVFIGPPVALVAVVAALIAVGQLALA